MGEVETSLEAILVNEGRGKTMRGRVREIIRRCDVDDLGCDAATRLDRKRATSTEVYVEVG
jgi:hypothetical protein